MEMKCFIVLLQISWVFAQGGGGNGGFEGFEGMEDFGGFSLIQKELNNMDGAGSSNDTANDTMSQPAAGGAGGEQLLFQPGGGVLADQPQQDPAVVPTRLPNPAAPTTAPPLVRPEGNATANATTVSPPPSENPSPKSKEGGGGSAEFIGNSILVLCTATVLHLLY